MWGRGKGHKGTSALDREGRASRKIIIIQRRVKAESGGKDKEVRRSEQAPEPQPRTDSLLS